jgi:hypothetical protein
MGAWLHDILVGWGERAGRAAGEVAPMIALGTTGDLHTVGRRLAADGHALEEILAWCTHLARRSRRFRTQLECGGVVQLANGWAEAALRQSFGLHAVAPVEVMRLRVQQQAARINSDGSASAHPLALVVIEVHGPASSQERVSEHAREVFSAGETLAATATGLVLVLVRRDHAVRRRSVRLLDAMRADEQLRGTTVRVWIEPLAMAAEHLDSHLLGLVS